MDGLGNDFLIFTDVEITQAEAVELCDRKNTSTGGADGVVLLSKSDNADIFMRIINSDGSCSNACGNATRCVAYLQGKAQVTIETNERILEASINDEQVEVNMGKPLISEVSSNFAKVDMGNPHISFAQANINKYDLNTLAKNLRADEDDFPEGVNVGIFEKLGENHFALRVNERGVGETKACGTGACAAFATAVELGIASKNGAKFSLQGGDLEIKYNDAGEILMNGKVSKHD